ncbi:MAG TPA: trigger factor, partial [Thermoanaerobaculia bacterium]|nr:trigger factor [Thermoanaerobaculia bacterium]
MSVVVSVEDTGVCRKQLTVEVPAPEVEAATRRVVGEYARRVRIPGFRAGKVPPELIRRRFREDVDRDVVERLVPDFWERARAEQGIEPLGQPKLTDVGEVAAGQPLRFVAVVEVRPPIELGDLSGFELPDPPAEPSDEEVDEALEDLRRQAGEWKDADRPAARGDQVAIRVREQKGAAEPAEGAEGAPGEEVADAPWQSIEIEVGEPRVWEELSLAVTGLGAGQRGRFTRRPDAGGEGEPRSFEVEVEAVRVREPAPLDDELAKKVGDFADLAALRRAVGENLAAGKRHEREQKRRESLFEQLRGRYPLQLPQGVVDAEVERMVHDFAHDLSHRGIDPRQAQVDWDKLAGELRGPAERRVHERLLLDAVAEREGIAVGAAEVEALVAAVARSEKA